MRNGYATWLPAIVQKASVVIGGGTVAPPAPGTLETDRILRAGLGDPAAQKALRIWGRGPRDWHRLSNIIEIVKANANITANGWASARQVERFDRTANHPDAAGDDARHGLVRVQPPPSPMTLAEAETLVGTVLESWLRSIGGRQ